MAGDESLHEAGKSLSAATLDMHRAIASLMEELEAVDWYQQRIDATGDAELKRILEHNRDEEKEHACMVVEWLRRNDSGFEEQLRRFLFTDGPIAGGGHGPGRSARAALVRNGTAIPTRFERRERAKIGEQRRPEDERRMA
jgi:hypothetical protein